MAAFRTMPPISFERDIAVAIFAVFSEQTRAIGWPDAGYRRSSSIVTFPRDRRWPRAPAPDAV
jgi:hypothetical protein